MFSLIITIISIALVAALALATLYYGGSAFSKGSAKADAAKILLQGQQLIGASELFQAGENRWPDNMDELRNSKYITSVPQAKADVQSAIELASAAGSEWTMPKKSTPMFLLPGVSGLDLCGYVNLQGSLKNKGVPFKAYPSLTIQCYGPDANTLKVIIKKSTDANSLADATDSAPGVLPEEIATGAPPTDPADPTWLSPPGATVGGPVVTTPVEPPLGGSDPATIGGLEVSYTTYRFPPTQVDEVAEPSVFPVLHNRSALGIELGDINYALSTDYFWLDKTNPPGNCPDVLPGGESCNLYLGLYFAEYLPGVITNTVTLSTGVGPIVFNLSGTVAPPQALQVYLKYAGNQVGTASVNGNQLSDAGAVQLGEVTLGVNSLSVTPYQFEVTNTSNVELTLDELRVRGGVVNAGTCLSTLPGNSSCFFEASLGTPTLNELDMTRGRIVSAQYHDAQNNDYYLFANIRYTATQTVTLDGGDFNPYELSPGETGTALATLTNYSAENLAFYATGQTSGTQPVVTDSCGGMLLANSTCTIQTTLTPTWGDPSIAIDLEVAFPAKGLMLTKTYYGSVLGINTTDLSGYSYGTYADVPDWISSGSYTFLVRNNSNASAPLQFNLDPETAAGAAAFTLDTACTSLAPGAACQATVYYSRTSTTEREFAQLQIGIAGYPLDRDHYKLVQYYRANPYGSDAPTGGPGTPDAFEMTYVGPSYSNPVADPLAFAGVYDASCMPAASNSASNYCQASFFQAMHRADHPGTVCRVETNLAINGRQIRCAN